LVLGRNMKAFLTNIRAEPGQWTAPALARDFGVSPSSARRSLRKLEALGLIRAESSPCDSCGQIAFRWFPDGHLSRSTTE
jgi:predicted ArsR family transcriptional regulator